MLLWDSAELLDVLNAGLESLYVAIQEAGLLFAELDADGLDDGLLGDDLGLLGDVRAKEDHVGALGVADALSDLVAGDIDGVDIVAVGFGAADERFLRDVATKDDYAALVGVNALQETFTKIGRALATGEEPRVA